MNDIQFGLIHSWLLDALEGQTYQFNNCSLAYFKKIKDAYNDFYFCVGKGYALDEISKKFNIFYKMVDARIMCLFNAAHRCKCALDTAVNRKSKYEEYATEECFCSLQNYMFKFLTIQND